MMGTARRYLVQENRKVEKIPSVLDQMQILIQLWEDHADDKVLFLRCYRLMTGNVLGAIDLQTFDDPLWVNRLLQHFADYYYLALQAFERNPDSAPAVWQQAHHAAKNPQVTALQKLLIGVNAHINYDLVLTLVDLLRPAWHNLTEEQRASRYRDHCQINEIIGWTIDTIQDQVLEPAMPVMDLVDRLLGPVDELLISKLITRWREKVWLHATHLLNIDNPDAQEEWIHQIEKEALQTGKFILL